MRVTGLRSGRERAECLLCDTRYWNQGIEIDIRTCYSLIHNWMPVRTFIHTLRRTSADAAVQLAPARLSGGKSLEECLRSRRSCRCYSDAALTLDDVGQLLWAAQGITGLGGLRAAPSAGAVYPVHCYLVALNVDGLRSGVYAYDPDRHILALWKTGDVRKKLVKAAFGEREPAEAAVCLLLTGSYGRAKREFGDRGIQLVHMETGHIAQNFFLQATSLGLGCLGISKIDNDAMRSALDLPEGEEPIYLLMAGAK